jgi:hypothetical protein
MVDVLEEEASINRKDERDTDSSSIFFLILDFKHESAGFNMQAFDALERRRSIALAHRLANQVLSLESTQPGFRQAQPKDRDIFQDGIWRPLISQGQVEAPPRPEHLAAD